MGDEATNTRQSPKKKPNQPPGAVAALGGAIKQNDSYFKRKQVWLLLLPHWEHDSPFLKNPRCGILHIISIPL